MPDLKRWSPAILLEAGALLVIGVLSVFPIATDDVWINVKTGERIWNEHAIPSVDDYSFTCNGARWVNHEWLGNLLFHGAYSAAGPNGLIFLKTALLLLTGLVMLRFARFCEASPVVAAALLAGLAFAASDRFIERAHLFNFLFIALFLSALYRAREGAPPRLTWLPLLQALWVNLHSGAVLGPMIVGLFLLGPGLRLALGRSPAAERSSARWLFWTFFLTLAASFANPYLGESLLYPFQQAGFDLYRQHVYEWMPIWAPPYAGSWMKALFVVSVAVVALSFLLPHRPALEDLLVFAFFLALAISAARFTAKLEIAAFFVLARRLRRVRPRAPAVAALSVALASGVIALAAVGNPIRGPLRKLGLGVNDRRYPDGACRLLESIPGGVRLYNQYDLGSYLIFRLYPRVKVFIDGRNQVFPESLYAEYLSVNRSPGDLDRVFKRYDIDAVLLLYDPDVRIPFYLAARGDWKLVWFDDYSVLFVAERPGRERFLEEHAYRFFTPLTRTPESDVLRSLGRAPDDVLRELERAAREAKGAMIPRLLLVSAYLALERREDAARWQGEADEIRRRYGLH